VVKVTRLGEISTFGLLFKGPGGFFVGKIWLVVCILIVYKGFAVDILDFQMEQHVLDTNAGKQLS